ncbi:MAG: hypothetical protein NE334_21525 [Lentisphaeraceae bacterium]|nr:hypothetical protein [Lentisphaeraceae bacterium]
MKLLSILALTLMLSGCLIGHGHHRGHGHRGHVGFEIDIDHGHHHIHRGHHRGYHRRHCD